MRSLASEFTTSINSGIVYPALLARLDFKDGPLLVWNGIGDLSFNNETYSGVGTFGNISEVEESTDLRANGLVLQLSGIPSDLITVALNATYQGREGSLFLALLNEQGALIAAEERFSGIMDTMDIEEGPQTSTIRLALEEDIIELKRARIRRYTDQDQRIDSPDDKGLEFVAVIQGKPILWGSPGNIFE